MRMSVAVALFVWLRLSMVMMAVRILLGCLGCLVAMSVGVAEYWAVLGSQQTCLLSDWAFFVLGSV